MSITETNISSSQKNNLFPVFFKLEQLRVLLIGAGNVALEKLTAIVNNAPATQVNVVAIHINEAFAKLAAQYATVNIEQKEYDAAILGEYDLIIAAVNDIELSKQIRADAQQAGKLINVADKPELCDFYLGSIVTKGNLKIAISTNGKSPTVAKRLKEVLNETLPSEMDEVLNNIQQIRTTMKGDFAAKVQQLNELTKVLVAKQEIQKAPQDIKWLRIVGFCLLAFLLMILGHALFSYISWSDITDSTKLLWSKVDQRLFLLMLLCGFLAQMTDGSLGMGYGTISTTFLLAIGVPPAIVSSRVHAARVFSSGVSGYSHHRFGNINKKLFRTLFIPGAIGAIAGATMAYFGQKYASYVKIPLSIYTLYLGYFIIRKTFGKKKQGEKVKQAGWLAAVGGFMDAFAGGGWGTLVTSTLMSKRRSPRYVIGSVCLAEFFVVLASSITFFILLESIPLLDVAGLILGGVIAAPIAARLVGKLPMKTMFTAVGSLVILTSINTMVKAILQVLHH